MKKHVLSPAALLQHHAAIFTVGTGPFAAAASVGSRIFGDLMRDTDGFGTDGSPAGGLSFV